MKTALDLIGSTPIVKLKKIGSEIEGEIFGKLESQNPSGSLKDRIAVNMIKAAEKTKALKPGMTILEPTSGNTGIGLAFVGAALGYDVVLTMPGNMSIERRSLLKAYGATLELTPAADGMRGAIDRAYEIRSNRDDVFLPNQFDNPANPEAHYRTTGPEIYKGLNGDLDAFVMGVGTGGTVAGVARYLNEKQASCDIVAVEPTSSAVLSGGDAGLHGIQGIGAGFIPEVLDTDLIDQIITVSEDESVYWQKRLSEGEGLLMGVSSGANISAAVEYLKDNPGARVATLLCDTGERYLA